MKEKKRSFKKTALKAFISIALLIAIYSGLDKESFIYYITNINLYYIPLILLLVVLNYVTSSIRWQKIIETYPGGDAISLGFLTRLYFIGAFFSTFLPTSIGGDVYKAVRLGKVLKDQHVAFAGTFLERFSGALTLVLFSSIGLISIYRWIGVALFILFWIGLVFGFMLLPFIGNKVPKLKKFVDAIYVFKDRKRVIAASFLLSLLVSTFAILTQHFIFIALGYDLSPGFSFFAFPIIILASFIVPSINSYGVQDWLYVTFFSTVGVPPEAAVSASIVYYFVQLAVKSLGGIFYAIEK